MRRSHAAVLALIVGVLLTACGADRENAGSGSPRRSTTTTSAQSLAVRWQGEFETSLPNGWVIRGCSGDRLNVCVHDGNELLGDLELNPDYPLAQNDVGKDQRQVALKLAAEMIAEFRRDRAEGCAAFTFKPDRVTDATVGTHPGARAGFALVDAKGTVVERVVNYYVVGRDKFAIVNVDAYVTEGGCLGPTEYDPSFTPPNLDKLEQFLDQIVADTPTEATRPAERN